MANNLVEYIVRSWIEAGLDVDGVEIVDGHLAYRLDGFAKSGCGLLYYSPTDDKVCLETRYGQVDEIDSFEDVVKVAYWWYSDSLHLGWVMHPIISDLYDSITQHNRDS